MGLKFYFGGSGAGKSTQLYKDIIQRSMKEPKTQFFMIVPDQFTMQTQKDMVRHHPRGGIMNIDVLSFGRLSHRIFEEVGGEPRAVLDDTGKSLILRKVAADLKDSLPALGSNLDKQGYIHEVKSAISEFMQYGIGVEDVKTLIAFSQARGALTAKLQDLEVLYRGFMEYRKEKYITTEETLDLLRQSLRQSKLIPGSVVVFDGFTGFTPIQNKLIQELMVLAKEVIVTVTMDARENPYEQDGEQKLFHLSKKTIYNLQKLAQEAGVAREPDVWVAPKQNRFTGNAGMAHLEQNLFRYPFQVYDEKKQGQLDSIMIFEASSPKEEVRQVGMKIRELIRERQWCFRDIAVVTGDLATYGEYVETEFPLFDIPFFLDRTRGILLNPFIEYIRSALLIICKNFSYESVFHYLRSGLADFTREETDELENYILQFGIRGRKKWSNAFTKRTKEMEADEKSFEKINTLRERLLTQLAPLFMKKETVQTYIYGLYDFLVQNRIEQKLTAYERYFQKQNDLAKAKEYAQIYRLVMDLLDQIMTLLSDEKMSLQEFLDILDAGFGEIEVGSIPQNVDRVVAGDIERTRLKEVKVLFFLGVNDGNIPKGTGKGGIISDIDREFLRQSQLELAPSPRQQMYIQRLYLYLNMTKPSEQLYLSFCKINAEGKAVRPAYLIDTMQKLFPTLTIESPQLRPMEEQLETAAGGLDMLAEQLRQYVGGYMEESGEPFFFTLYHLYEQDDYRKKMLQKLTDAASYRYADQPLGKVVARALYGQTLENSVSRLETYAACAYEHFLQYGLSLKEREIFQFESVDMGNIFHGVLERFARKLEEHGCTWFDFPKELGEQMVQESLESYAAEYGSTVLYSSARNEYAITRMKRILTRTVMTLQQQLQKGSFIPRQYEMGFSMITDLEDVNIALSRGEKMKLRGRIDRVDTYEDEEHVYVKVIDYKSGNHKFDLVALYYGLQLQLVVYLNGAMEQEKRKHPEKQVVPAALLYYHVADPVISAEKELSPEEVNAKLLSELRMNGVVNGEDNLVEKLDHYVSDKSDVIPIERKKDGTFSARSSVMGREEFQIISSYVNHKIREIGRDILNGKKNKNPYERGQQYSCTYCAYRAVCGFDKRLYGYQTRKLEEISKEEAFANMKEQSENGARE